MGTNPFTSYSSSVTVNGVMIKSTGDSINIVGGKVFVDGKDVTPDSKVVSIVVNGNVDHIDGTFSDLTINGNVTGNATTMSGDIQCNDVGGNVESVSGDIEAGKIYGNVESVSGDISHD